MIWREVRVIGETLRLKGHTAVNYYDENMKINYVYIFGGIVNG